MINSGGDMERAYAARQAQVGGDWFFWIAGLSIVNSLMRFLHLGFGFFFGLGTTDFFDFNLAPLGPIVLVLDVLAAGIFALFGLFARRGQSWAFLIGMGLYVLDAVVALLLIHQYLEVAAHAYALFRIFQGFQGAQRLAALRAQPSPYPGGPPPGSTPGVWPPPPSA